MSSIPDYTRKELIDMRECLRQAQKLLPIHSSAGNEFICHNITNTTCDEETQENTKNYVMRSLEYHGTFNSWMTQNNNGHIFTGSRIMKLRREWIDMLCAAINKRLMQRNYTTP